MESIICHVIIAVGAILCTLILSSTVIECVKYAVRERKKQETYKSLPESVKVEIRQEKAMQTERKGSFKGVYIGKDKRAVQVKPERRKRR